MREGIGAVAAAVLGLILLVALSWGGFLLYLKVVEGPAINQHTLNVRHSIGYIDAQNTHARDLMAEFSGAPVGDSAHRCALLLDIRSTEGQLVPNEVSTDVGAFMSQHATECGGN